MSNKIHRLEYQEQLVFIWFLEQDTGTERNTIKIYAVAPNIEGARRHVMGIPGLGSVARHLVENTEPIVCETPFAEANISANGRVGSLIRAERMG